MKLLTYGTKGNTQTHDDKKPRERVQKLFLWQFNACKHLSVPHLEQVVLPKTKMPFFFFFLLWLYFFCVVAVDNICRVSPDIFSSQTFSNPNYKVF